MHSPYKMGNKFSGCKMADCDRAMQCLRYVGAKDREPDNLRDRWVLVEDTKNCQDFIKILSPEEVALESRNLYNPA
jgi:hypothetical protein